MTRYLLESRGDVERTIVAIQTFSATGSLQLDIAPGKDADRRRDLIKSVRAGEHHEVDMTAIVFRQRDGEPNRKHVRVAAKALPALAASFKDKPVLVDHNQSKQAARIGTITGAQLSRTADGWDVITASMRIVKPEAVISVLDGTIDAWSVGMHPTGPINCSVHGKDLRSAGACGCWPGDRTTDAEGTAHVVEFEFQSVDGVELSAVNVPAVPGARTTEVRQALALELGLYGREHDLEVTLPERATRSAPDVDAVDLELARVAAVTGQDIAKLRAARAKLHARYTTPEDTAQTVDTFAVAQYLAALDPQLVHIARDEQHLAQLRAEASRIAKRRFLA